MTSVVVAEQEAGIRFFGLHSIVGTGTVFGQADTSDLHG